MDFSKAKTVLIIVFFGLNLFLGYQIMVSYRMVSFSGGIFGDAMDLEQMDRLEQSLEDNNYTLKGELPRATRQKSFLRVSPPQVRVSELIELFFGEEPEKQETFLEKRAYYHPIGRLDYYFNGFYKFTPQYNPEKDETNKESDRYHKEQASETAEAFLEEKQLKPDNIRKDMVIENEEGDYKVWYHQVWMDVPIYSSYIMVTIRDGEVTQMESYWMEPVGTDEDKKMEVLPATEALVRFLDRQGLSHQERIIEEVELGYYSQEYDADKWEIPPVWRVVMENGDIYFINAFTGNLEYTAEETS